MEYVLLCIIACTKTHTHSVPPDMMWSKVRKVGSTLHNRTEKTMTSVCVCPKTRVLPCIYMCWSLEVCGCTFECCAALSPRPAWVLHGNRTPVSRAKAEITTTWQARPVWSLSPCHVNIGGLACVCCGASTLHARA